MDVSARLHPAASTTAGDPGRSSSAAHPAATITRWAADEHRLGRLAVRRRVWAPQGPRPLARVERHDEWRSVDGCVRPRTGRSWWCLLPTVNTAAMSLALATCARDEGIAVPHRAVVVVDRAGWPIAGDLRLPEGSDLIFLPAASPELPPAARLWTLVDAPIVTRAVPNLDALATVLVERCQRLEADPQRLKAHTHFHWWPADASPGLVQ